MQAVALNTYINSKLRIYQYGVPAVASLAAGIICVLTLLMFRANSDQHLLKDIAPHLSTLVESQDRSEMARLAKSIARERGVEIIVVRNKNIVVSSESLDVFDKEYLPSDELLEFAGSRITKNHIVSFQEVKRPGGPDTNTVAIIKTPLTPILLGCLFVAFIILIAGFILSYLFAHRISLAVREIIKPIEKIEHQIHSLQNMEPVAAPPTGIIEFDAIQATIIDTQRAIIDARDAMATAKAKEMTTEAYRRLIHDLHTPVSALQQMISTASITEDADDKKAASEAIPKIAEQVVTQIETAKKHLGMDIQLLRPDDIRECVKDSIVQATESNPRKAEVEVAVDLPEVPVVLPHDPNQLRRAVSNILVNALQACKNKIHVTLEEHNNKVIIRIDDDGPGISSDKVSTFLQGKGTSTKADRKAYGMAGANHIVRLHGGRIVFRDSALGGACFEVQL